METIKKFGTLDTFKTNKAVNADSVSLPIADCKVTRKSEAELVAVHGVAWLKSPAKDVVSASIADMTVLPVKDGLRRA